MWTGASIDPEEVQALRLSVGFRPIADISEAWDFSGMRESVLTILAFAISGCSDGTPPSAYKHVRDQLRAVTGLDVPCFRTIEGEPGRLPDRDCYQFGEPKRMQGVVNSGFESGSFYQQRTAPPSPGDRSDTWLRLEPVMLPNSARRACEDGCVVWLDFVGRQTTVDGSYGHMGLAKHLIVADKIIGAKVLE